MKRSGDLPSPLSWTILDSSPSSLTVHVRFWRDDGSQGMARVWIDTECELYVVVSDEQPSETDCRELLADVLRYGREGRHRYQDVLPDARHLFGLGVLAMVKGGGR